MVCAQWVANCVGFHNYKFFFQFLAYSMLFLLFVASTCARYFVLYLKGSLSSAVGPHIAAMCFIAAVFMLSIGSLLAMHIHLLRSNETTVGMWIARTHRHTDTHTHRHTHTQTDTHTHTQARVQ